MAWASVYGVVSLGVGGGCGMGISVCCCIFRGGAVGVAWAACASVTCVSLVLLVRCVCGSEPGVDADLTDTDVPVVQTAAQLLPAVRPRGRGRRPLRLLLPAQLPPAAARAAGRPRHRGGATLTRHAAAQTLDAPSLLTAQRDSV